MDLFSDSTGVVAFATSPVESSATADSEIADFFDPELVQNRIVTVSFERTAFIEVDVLTKDLGPGIFYRFMGVIIGLMHDNDPTTVQVLQAFRADVPRPRGTVQKPIRDSPSPGRGARKEASLQWLLRSPPVIAHLELRREAGHL